MNFNKCSKATNSKNKNCPLPTILSHPSQQIEILNGAIIGKLIIQKTSFLTTSKNLRILWITGDITCEMVA